MQRTAVDNDASFFIVFSRAHGNLSSTPKEEGEQLEETEDEEELEVSLRLQVNKDKQNSRKTIIKNIFYNFFLSWNLSSSRIN